MSKDNNIIDLSKAKKRNAQRTLEKAKAKKNKHAQSGNQGQGSGSRFSSSSGKPHWTSYLQFIVLLLLLSYAMTLCSR